MAENRIPSLDGLRAVSIALVLVSHAAIALWPNRQPPWFLTPGGLGVVVFFGISGFLITSLLLREHEETGRVDLKAFYFRRTFRIIPALWAFLTVSAVVGAACFTAAEWRNSALFLSDYLFPPSWWLGHTWSLAVEEQFYLLWPLTLWALGPRAATRFAWALALGAPALRAGLHLAFPSWPAPYGFHNRMDAIVVGCLIALLCHREPRHWLLALLRRTGVAAVSVVFLLVLAPALEHRFGGAYRVFGRTAQAFAVGSLLLWSIAHPSAILGRALNARPVVHVGVLSYSLYLWQQPFFDPHAGATWLGRFPVCVLGPLLLAEASYRLVERPMLRARGRISSWASRRAAPTEDAGA